jgi:site-specific DNA-methyltransferase (adenine-specific)
MNEYYHTDNGILYNGEAIEIMSKLPDNSVDCIITDLPYGVTQNKIDIPIPFDLMWKEIKRIRKDNTPIILFGQSKFFFKLCLSNEKEFRYDLVWDKELVSGFLNAKRIPLRQHEHIAVFYKKAGKYNPQMWEGKPLHSKGKNYKNKEIKNQNYGEFNHTDDNRAGETLKYPRSIISFQKPHPSKAIHPTEKPLELMEYLVKTYSNERDLVLDFTCGSGTTLLAAEKLNRKWIGIELESKYCELSKQKLKGEIK